MERSRFGQRSGRPWGGGRYLSWLANLALLVATVVVVASGLVADRLDLNQVALHSQAGYLMAVLVVVHVVRHRRALLRPRQAGPRSSPGVVPASPGPGERTPTGVGSAPSPTAGSRFSRRVALAATAAGVAGAGVGWFGRAAAGPGVYEGGDPGLFYHRESSLGLIGLLSTVTDWGRAPDRYKRVDGPAELALPLLEVPYDMSVVDALARRRSRRAYADRALSASELAWIVHAATGITSADERRVAPSAGALFPIEVYVAAARVDGVPAGLYHVGVQDRVLDTVRSGSVSGDLVLAGLGQGFLGDAPAVLVLTGLFQRTRWKYRARYYRYVCWEAGHIAQNVYLAAEAAGLGACVVGAFVDSRLNGLLDIDGRAEAALGLIAVGPRR
ncbi:MAG: SagB/ThcOx family dehydrogenase [Acidimicrobiia bacterium]|nr:SagB/ThcOx family dehydrogenase [Acidimicrobiia bacterium]